MIVVGGGPSGLATARVLAAAGTDVVVLEARPDIGQGFSARVPATVTLGTLEHPHRLALGLGDADTAALIAFARANLALARAWLAPQPTGVLYAAGMPGEEDDIAAGSALLTRLGVDVVAWSTEVVAAKTGAAHLGPGRFVPEEALLDPSAALHRLADQARDAGAAVHTGCRVLGATETDRLQVHLDGRSLTAEVVVWAAGAACRSLAADFRDTVWPVRLQSVATGPGAGATGPPGRAQHGHLAWCTAEGGARVLTGCRWATPHLEVGETDEDALSPLVDARLRTLLDRTWPGATAERAWAGIAAFTCDGLPILGPLPGHPRQVACVGYGGSDWSLALRAGQAVAQGLLTGRTFGVPERFSPARFV